MSVLGRLAFIFVVVPLVELALLIRIGQWMGFWPTMALVLLTGVVGAWLARSEGLRTLWKVRGDLDGGRIPHQAMQDGVSILLGGALLLTPGILTDIMGFALLLPPSRHWIQRRFRRRIEESIARGRREGRIRVGMFHSGPAQEEGVDVQEAEDVSGGNPEESLSPRLPK